MNRLIAWGILCCLLAACGDKKMKTTPVALVAQETDSTLLSNDTVMKTALPEEPIPTKADESFDDFIYNFVSDEALQRQRVKFPLACYNENEKTNIEKDQWKHDDLFLSQNYYTLLFDHEDDMDLVGDTSLTSVQVEWITLQTQKMKKYYFERIKGAWILEAINLYSIEQDESEDFVTFFGRFATDSLFQSERVQTPLTFITTDPDDDFAILETTLDLNQWFVFKPVLPTEYLSNINYGQRNDAQSPTKILALRGIGNGLSNIFYFRRRNGKWKLYKYEDTSV